MMNSMSNIGFITELLSSHCSECRRIVISTLPKRPNRQGLEQLVAIVAIMQMAERPLCLKCMEKFVSRYGWNNEAKVQYYGVKAISEIVGFVLPISNEIIGLLFHLGCSEFGTAAQKEVLREIVEPLANEYKARGLIAVNESEIQQAYLVLREQFPEYF
jgi:hypothetical protein